MPAEPDLHVTIHFDHAPAPTWARAVGLFVIFTWLAMLVEFVVGELLAGLAAITLPVLAWVLTATAAAIALTVGTVRVQLREGP